MLDRLLHACARLSIRHPVMVLIVAVVLAAASVVYAALQLELNADTDDLIARDRPFMEGYLAFLDEFGDLEYLYVVIETPGDTAEDIARAEACVDFLGHRLAGIDLLPGVFYAIEPDEQLRIASRAMDDENLRDMAQTADGWSSLLAADDAGPALRDADRRLRDLIRHGAGMEDDARERLASSAIFQLQAIASAQAGSSAEEEMAWLLSRQLQREYLRTDTGRFYLIAIMPVKDYGTMSVIEEPLRKIREALDEARERFPEIEMGLTGKPVLQADEMRTTEGDMTRASIMAVILVSILFMLVIGGVWHPALGVVALMFGIAWTFGLTTITLGQLNLLSIVFTLVLVGVGIDFGIHIISRYKEQLHQDSIEDAVTTALTTAGRGNITGAITSAIAFYMAMFTDFQGLRELGFIAGTGLLLCLLAMSTVLPALIVVFDRKRAAWKQGAGAPPPLPPKTSFETFVWTWLVRHPGTVLIIVIVISAGLSPFITRVGFQENLLDLQARGLESVEWEKRLLEDSAETWFGAIIVNSKEDVLEVIDRAEAQDPIGAHASIFDIIQPPSADRDAWRSQMRSAAHAAPPEDMLDENEPWDAGDLRAPAERLRFMAGPAEREDPEAAARFRALADALEALADELGMDEETAAQARQRIDEHTSRVAESLVLILEGDAAELRDALPRALRDRFVSPQGRFLVKVHPRRNIWDMQPLREFVAAMREIDPQATGVPITVFESMIDMQRAFRSAALLAFAAVFVLLVLDLRHTVDVAFALLPLLVGLLWLIELMGLTGVKFNLANFFAVPILIGIGVDSGIHIMRRYREGGPRRLDLGSTRRAVFMTSMTSLIGFGCLITASHRGLQSLGLVMMMGAGSCLIASLIVVPALLAWRERVFGNPGNGKQTRRATR